MRTLAFLLAVGFLCPDATAQQVVVLQSDTLAPYQEAVEAFQINVGQDVRVIDLRGERERAVAVAHQLQKAPPDLVFAVGAKAAT